MKKIILFLLVYLVVGTNSVFALIKVDITRGNLDPLPIAVSPLHVEANSKEVYYKKKKLKNVGLMFPWRVIPFHTK